MKLVLSKKPKRVVILEGFPGFGLIGTIATEFLIGHLNAKPIGKIIVEEVPPIVAVHGGEAVEPLGIFYDQKHNLVILHALTSVAGLEWEIMRAIKKLVKELDAKEVISLEGIGGPPDTTESRAFYITRKKDNLKKTGAEPLKEGIIMGVTGALLLQKDVPLSCLFAETHTTLPDSRAAAKIIEVLDKYLGLKVDYKPLIEKAEKFETKIKGLLEKGRVSSELKKQKELSYLG